MFAKVMVFPFLHRYIKSILDKLITFAQRIGRVECIFIKIFSSFRSVKRQTAIQVQSKP